LNRFSLAKKKLTFSVGSRARDICLSQLTDSPLPILENRTRMAGICLPLAGDKYIHFLPDSWLPFRQVQLSVAKKDSRLAIAVSFRVSISISISLPKKNRIFD